MEAFLRGLTKVVFASAGVTSLGHYAYYKLTYFKKPMTLSYTDDVEFNNHLFMFNKKTRCVYAQQGHHHTGYETGESVWTQRLEDVPEFLLGMSKKSDMLSDFEPSEYEVEGYGVHNPSFNCYRRITSMKPKMVCVGNMENLTDKVDVMEDYAREK